MSIARRSRRVVGTRRNEHGGARDEPATKIAERFVGVRERIRGGTSYHWYLGRECEELLGVPARQVRNRLDDTLLPQILVGEARNVAHVDAATHNGSTLRHSA